MTIGSDIATYNEIGLKQLDQLLASNQAVLFVGAGCSVEVGYPAWIQLMQELADKLMPGVPVPSEFDVKLLAFHIKNCCRKANAGRLDPYWRLLRERFSPRSPTHLDFHCDLVRLPFSGFVTTNYDTVVEAALSEAFRHQRHSCQQINLCDSSARYRVLNLLRELSSPDRDRYKVLHLHGHYDQPESLILAQDDYERTYNRRALKDDGTFEDPQQPPEQSFHRKLVWSLLATKGVVFVGFSLEDPFFRDVLEVWRTDFDLMAERPHVAIMACTSPDDIQSQGERLQRLGITPIFYEVVGPNRSDHSGLKSLIGDIARRHGVRQSQTLANEITARNIEVVK